LSVASSSSAWVKMASVVLALSSTTLLLEPNSHIPLRPSGLFFYVSMDQSLKFEYEKISLRILFLGAMG
jgi:hypothetical protein